MPHPHQQDSHPSNEVFRGVRRKVGGKAFLVRGFPQQLPSHFSSPPRDEAQSVVTASDQCLYPIPGGRVEKEPRLAQSRLQSDPRIRNYF